MIKAYLNLCLLLFLDMLACMAAFLAAATVMWAALCGIKWIAAAFRNTVITLKTRQRRKETYAPAAR